MVSGLLYSASTLAGFWTVASLAASWFVYDHSPLMTGGWIPRAIGAPPSTWVNIHSGLDETTGLLRTLVGGEGQTFDIFDPIVMTEPSIARARLSVSSRHSKGVDFRRLPLASQSTDAAFLHLSAHELRTAEARTVLLSEVHRVLKPGGRAIVVEHLRDWPNLFAFGPGFLHFHSRRTWLQSFDASGLTIHDEFPMTPFVRIFVLRRPT
jgi:SAM-dependent methyltransferase